MKRLANKPFSLIGVNSDSDREKIQKICKDKSITWRSFWNGGGTRGPISTTWNVSGWPTIYVMDAKGVIRFKDVRGEAMDHAVDTLLAEMEKEKKKEKKTPPTDGPKKSQKKDREESPPAPD